MLRRNPKNYMNNTNNITEFINHVKHNYKTNLWGYVLVWILLLIPIPFCIVQTVELYNWNGDIKFFKRVKCHGEERDWIEQWLGRDFEEYFSPLVKDPQLISLLFFILSIVVITAVIILSSRNNKDFKYRRSYITLSVLLYFTIICVTLSWYSNVTIMINDYNYTVLHALTGGLIVCFVIIGTYLGISYIFYRIISRFIRKRKMILMVLCILILLPIWVLISMFFVIFIVIIVLI